jgi:hypothetical protein
VLGAVDVNQRSQGELLEVVHALDPPRCLAGGLDRRQQQRNQDADDRDDHQQLDQGETSSAAHGQPGSGGYIEQASR